MPRSIDHLVLAVPDLAAAADRYRTLGFTVGSENRHPWGTVNAIVRLGDAYLELISLAASLRPLPENDPSAPFTHRVQAAVARGGGLAALALSSEDADADAEAFRAAGLGAGRRLDFARAAETPEGGRRLLRFSLAFADVPGLPEAGLFTCRHHQTFGDGAPPRHANGACRLDGVVLAADDPAGPAPALAAAIGAALSGPPSRPALATPTGRLDVLTPADAAARYGWRPAPGRFAGFGVAVEAMEPVWRLLDAEGVPHVAVAGALVVPPSAAFGAALAFGPAACHPGP